MAVVTSGWGKGDKGDRGNKGDRGDKGGRGDSGFGDVCFSSVRWC